jgi:hypothetical protein
MINLEYQSLSLLQRLNIVVIGTCFMVAPSYASENDVQWRLVGDGDSISLLYAGAEATDNVGALSFECKRANGTIKVSNVLDQRSRKAVADLIASKQYPQLGSGTDLISVSFNDVDGWVLNFELSAESRMFSDFQKIGIFQYKLGKIPVRTDAPAGLDNVRRFQRMCTHSGPGQ